MTPEAVLILGAADGKLTELLFNAGYAPLVRQTMHGALEKLQHEQFAAVLVERGRVTDDVLEFVLNVRDINAEAPVVIIGCSQEPSDDRALLNGHRIYIVKSLKGLARFLRNVLSGQQPQK